MSSINRLCLLDKKVFIEGHNFIVSTTGKYIIPTERVIDTLLIGYEYVLVQKLLSQSLKIPLPVTGAIDFNHGITVREGANKQVISSQADSLIKISRIWAD
ncbi:hypothetical protein LNM74_13465, partial [Klebsiella pneumoniae]|nr:hypothetical protein [Klebsiella pneumoniae]